MIQLTDEVMEAIRAHAADAYKEVDARGQSRESCGLVIIWKGRQRYIACRNIAENQSDFQIHPDDARIAEDMGEIIRVVHSHPNIAPTPTQADLVECEKGVVPWLIVNWPTGIVYEFEPSGYKAPLVGRVFSHGTLDCYAAVRDYYMETLSIALPDFPREDDWWHKGGNLYLEGFEAAGFQMVNGKPRQHDGLLMKVNSPVPNHAAVFLGDGNIFHHFTNRLSSKDVYGGWWEKMTVHIVRHKDLM